MGRALDAVSWAAVSFVVSLLQHILFWVRFICERAWVVRRWWLLTAEQRRAQHSTAQRVVPLQHSVLVS